ESSRESVFGDRQGMLLDDFESIVRATIRRWFSALPTTSAATRPLPKKSPRMCFCSCTTLSHSWRPRLISSPEAPEQSRLVVILRYGEGLDPKEISEFTRGVLLANRAHASGRSESWKQSLRCGQA